VNRGYGRTFHQAHHKPFDQQAGDCTGADADSLRAILSGLEAGILFRKSMKKAGMMAACAGFAYQTGVFASGVTPYLPLNLEPEIEAQIERVLILGDKPVMSRPIPASMVLAALPKACQIDERLCRQVQRYLARYTHDSGITHGSIEAAAHRGSDPAMPNRYGMGDKSSWDLSGTAYYQPSDYLLVNVGAINYRGRTDYTGSYLSLGFSWAQIDLGYRPHWFSPMTDSSMLMGTEASTMPSFTLSNSEPFSPLGIKYEIFDARMSESSHIKFDNGVRRGHPMLFGARIAIEPVSGWSFAVNRLLQYGGAGRPSSFKDLYKAFLNPAKYDNTNPDLTFDQQFGNEEASFTSSFLFHTRIPFAVYAEYAGEDTSRGRSYLLGNAALSWGIHFPRLFERFDLTFETSEWQNLWYIHDVYLDGLTNNGRVVGNWFGDQRYPGDAVGGRSNMVRLAWDATFGGLVELRYRTVQNQQYGLMHYDRYHDLTVGYSRPFKGAVVGGNLDLGRDVFGASFTRLEGFVRYDEGLGGLGTALGDLGGGEDSGEKKGELFVDAGVNMYRLRTDLTDEDNRTTAPKKNGAHFAIGARRFVTEHGDLGTRVELDDIEGHSLIGVRLIDYRYRIFGPIAVDAFLGAARYALATPAYGVYYGGGLQWRNVLPGVDIGADLRFNDSIARDHVLPTDPHSPRPDSFYDVWGGVFSISYHY
jgi:hypothetical protein